MRDKVNKLSHSIFWGGFFVLAVFKLLILSVFGVEKIWHENFKEYY